MKAELSLSKKEFYIIAVNKASQTASIWPNLFNNIKNLYIYPPRCPAQYIQCLENDSQLVVF